MQIEEATAHGSAAGWHVRGPHPDTTRYTALLKAIQSLMYTQSGYQAIALVSGVQSLLRQTLEKEDFGIIYQTVMLMVASKAAACQPATCRLQSSPGCGWVHVCVCAQFSVSMGGVGPRANCCSSIYPGS